MLDTHFKRTDKCFIYLVHSYCVLMSDLYAVSSHYTQFLASNVARFTNKHKRLFCISSFQWTFFFIYSFCPVQMSRWVWRRPMDGMIGVLRAVCMCVCVFDMRAIYILLPCMSSDCAAKRHLNKENICLCPHQLFRRFDTRLPIWWPIFPCQQANEHKQHLDMKKKILPHTNTYTAYDWNKDLLKMMNKLWQINRSHFIYAQCSMAEILLTLWNWAVVLFCVRSFCVSDHFYLRNTMIGSGWLSFYLTSFQFLWQRFTPFDVCAPNWTWAFWHCSPIYGYLHFWIIFIPTNNS